MSDDDRIHFFHICSDYDLCYNCKNTCDRPFRAWCSGYEQDTKKPILRLKYINGEYVTKN
jgi:hypothetical protein